MTISIYGAVGITLLVLVLVKIVPTLVKPRLSPLNQLPGPPNPSWVHGHFKERFTNDNLLLQEKWVEEYGNNIALKAAFGGQRLYTHDVKVLNHVLSHPLDFRKPVVTKYTLTNIVGPGLLIAEGEQHKVQRRVMNPAFGPVQIRELTDVMVRKAAELRDMWKGVLPSDGTAVRINVLDGLSRMTLDVIGLAGFAYNFDALDSNPSHPNELNEAFKTIFEDNDSIVQAIAKAMLPPLRYIPTKRARRLEYAMRTMRRIGMDLIQKKKEALLSEKSGGVEKSDIQGRDLLSLLIKANLATDIPENMRMDDDDILAQVPTFIIAGHETTSTAVTWGLYSLSLNPGVQQKLREELSSVSTNTPSVEDLADLPYLDMVVREILRVHAPVPQTIRVAAKDEAIPAATPFKDKNGIERDTIHVAEGDLISVPILALNRDKRIWGENALEFHPERWENPPEAITSMPGVWGHVLSFLAGPRACIGYRFAVIEMKVLLFTLLRAFKFELAVKSEDIGKVTTIVQRPIVLSEKDSGSQMPLLVKAYHSD